MLSVKIRSRLGNVVLVGLGVTYALMGVVLLVWSLIAHWGATTVVEYALFALLVAATACGIWFTILASQNLGIRPRFHRLHHA